MTISFSNTTLVEQDIELQLGSIVFPTPTPRLCLFFDFANVSVVVCIFPLLQQELIFPKILEGLNKMKGVFFVGFVVVVVNLFNLSLM